MRTARVYYRITIVNAVMLKRKAAEKNTMRFVASFNVERKR